MEALTLEHALENKFTPIDCIKYFKPEWTDEECDFYLWEFTCFPFSIQSFIKQLNEKFIHGGRWKCMLCGRDKFTHKSPHKCVGGYRKRKIIWQEI